MHIRKLGRYIRISLGLGLVTAMISGSVVAQEKHGGTLVMVQPVEPSGLVSAVNTSNYNATISTKIHEGLVVYDEKFQPTPSLATSWEISPDGKKYVFHLRKGVKWHDGKDFTADDVEFSVLNVWKTAHPRGRATFSQVTGVQKPDSHTVVLELSEPSPTIMAALSSYESPIVPRHIYEGGDMLQHPALGAPIGTGPFKFAEWKKGEYIRLVRNDDYWDKPKPYLDELILRIIPDGSSRAAAIESGGVQLGVFNSTPLADVKRLSQIEGMGIETRGYDLLSPMYLMELNLSNEYLKHTKVRQAIAHAIDKDFLVKNIWFGFGKPATGPLTSKSPYYVEDGIAQYAFDVELANRLLDEAGYPAKNGTRFTLSLDTLRDPETLRAAEYVKQAMRRVGIQVTIRNSDLGTFIRNVYADYDFGMTLNFFSLLSDPTLGTERLYISSNIKKGTPFANASQFRNERVDALLKQARSEPDAETRRTLFREFQTIVQQELPILNLFEMQFVTLYSDKVKNHTVTGEGPYASFKEVYLAE